MGRISKGVACSVEGCGERAVHSLSLEETRVLESKGYSLTAIHGRVYLCEKHYKEWKKARKKLDKFEKWRMMR